MYDKGREKTENTVGERSVMRETMTEVKSKGVYLFVSVCVCVCGCGYICVCVRERDIER